MPLANPGRNVLRSAPAAGSEPGHEPRPGSLSAAGTLELATDAQSPGEAKFAHFRSNWATTLWSCWDLVLTALPQRVAPASIQRLPRKAHRRSHSARGQPSAGARAGGSG